MGVATILASRQVLMLAFGAGKAQAVAEMVEGAVSARWPATALQAHPAVTVFLDESFRLPAGIYRYLPSGVHLVTLRAKDWPRLRRSLIVRDGERWRIEIGDQRLDLVRESPGPGS